MSETLVLSMVCSNCGTENVTSIRQTHCSDCGQILDEAERFRESHPELRGYLPYILGAYQICPVQRRALELASFEHVRQHIFGGPGEEGCVHCKWNFERTKKSLESLQQP